MSYRKSTQIVDSNVNMRCPCVQEEVDQRLVQKKEQETRPVQPQHRVLFYTALTLNATA